MNVIRSAAVLALLVAACSGGEDIVPITTAGPTTEAVETTSTTTKISTTTTSTMTSTSTTTTTSAPAEGTDEEQIAALVEAYWQAVGDNFDPPRPDPELWAAVATPELTPFLVENAEEDVAAGIGLEVPDRTLVASTDISVINVLAIVFLCLTEVGRTYDLASGETIEELNSVTLKRMEAVVTASGWRVASSETLERFEPGDEELCAESYP